ncbi:unnamed protein product [Linum tenue]|nr:unnamed protein product [Linum tenue]
MKIGKRIGKPLRVDQATSTGARLDYARVCVQVDLTKPLLSQFRIHGIKYFIQYEGLDKICLKCGKFFDHIGCPCSFPEVQQGEGGTKPPETPSEPEPEKVYGVWMIAKKKPRAGRQENNSKGKQIAQHETQNKVPHQSGSRFTALVNEEVMEEDGAQVVDTTQERPKHGRGHGRVLFIPSVFCKVTWENLNCRGRNTPVPRKTRSLPRGDTTVFQSCSARVSVV